MPRDDLSIDFVEKMPQQESVDPAQILDDFFYRFQNIPEEIRFIQAEITDKDRQVNDCLRIVEDRDSKIQRWIKTNGSHLPNPREDTLRTQIRENYAKAEKLSDEKLALSKRLQELYDRQILYLDRQIKGLYDRVEPGFNDPDEVPSLLRNSAANLPTPSFRTNVSNGPSIPSTPIHTTQTATLPISNKAAVAHIRSVQTQQHAASAPATPAASLMLNRQARETSAGPTSGAPKRAPRSNTGLSTTPANPSGLARHSSLGPGPSKAAAATGASGAVRAGSAGPRTSTTKATTAGVGRKGTPTAPGRKKTTAASGTKSSLFRVKKASSKNSPASPAESDLSEAESGSVVDDDAAERRSNSQRAGSGTPSRGSASNAAAATVAANKQEGGDGAPVKEDTEMADAEDEEGGDDKKYCLCQHVSFGDMVACDNDNCPYEWFHWSCVGLKSEPNGKWYCPVCSGKKAK
ncbi:hypothetical protein jhhlp_007325 [Lomentospora prolificans]|uniref:Chromatin modification-related protein n=1 Tax=Lomentospora prolificans TaxID=41688 RepID=A0A2N3N2C6_9PEZI|nr:hypothetical protein jhhlp_007325 [Lomentospora prolificans]